MRCKVSAHEHRIKKKQEATCLNHIIKVKDEKMSILVNNIILHRLKDNPDVISQILEDLSEQEP